MTNYKAITTVAVAFLLLILVGYIYINSLNAKISYLNSIIDGKDSVIVGLNKNIDDLNKHIKSLDNTISITDEYISDIVEVRSENEAIKSAIYEEVINDDTGTVKDWLNERLPDNLKYAILKNSNNLRCE